jgi:hypothetical protein
VFLRSTFKVFQICLRFSTIHQPSSLSVCFGSSLFHFHFQSPQSTPPSTSNFLPLHPSSAVMAEKASSQQTADALFLLDALQHVTSTVVVSLSLYFNSISLSPSLAHIHHQHFSDQRRRDRSPKTRQSKHDPKALHHDQATLQPQHPDDGSQWRRRCSKSRNPKQAQTSQGDQEDADDSHQEDRHQEDSCGKGGCDRGATRGRI